LSPLSFVPCPGADAAGLRQSRLCPLSLVPGLTYKSPIFRPTLSSRATERARVFFWRNSLLPAGQIVTPDSHTARFDSLTKRAHIGCMLCSARVTDPNSLTDPTRAAAPERDKSSARRPQNRDRPQFSLVHSLSIAPVVTSGRGHPPQKLQSTAIDCNTFSENGRIPHVCFCVNGPPGRRFGGASPKWDWCPARMSRRVLFLPVRCD
jgi:hypothetical protein